MSVTHDDSVSSHSHGSGLHLTPQARAILERGLTELLERTRGLDFQPLPSERYPLPLAQAVFGQVPEPERVRQQVIARLSSDPVSVLEEALVLLELVVCNQPHVPDCILDDDAFLSQTFATKRANGWAAILGGVDRDSTEAAVTARWRVKFIAGDGGSCGIYPFVNLIVRYGLVYGKLPAGDSHALGHFIEEFAPGVLLCQERLDDLALTLSLAAMKIGIPAVVPQHYPFPLGRQARVEGLDELVEAMVLFPNMHRLLDLPDLPRLPEYASAEQSKEQFEPAAIWGDTPESFYILRQGRVNTPGVEVIGSPEGDPALPLGAVLTVDAQPLDPFDRRYIEERAARALSMVRGVVARHRDGRLRLDLASSHDLTLERVGEMLVAAVRHEFPKISRVQVRVIVDRDQLARMASAVHGEVAQRARAIESTTEEKLGEFATCVGCSPFAPDHVCILTPERPPQCGRRYEQIRTGALYGYDDMTNIHHRLLHASINSFGICAKGDPIDPIAGEWSGVNEAVVRLSGGRTTRVQLHALDQAPPTGCSCFQLIMFESSTPRAGVAIMDRRYKGEAPDGRTWTDLHYALTGKQTPGMAGASLGYLVSRKFLAGHGGWQSVVWVSPRIAAFMGQALPDGVEVGPVIAG